ncbi:MAG TPA: class I SAM-dependent methyltransferase [Acidimicrobiia bacterium]|nr:class I SAM-dependent methyltransferase [Acidimicrobiia bacterium]
MEGRQVEQEIKFQDGESYEKWMGIWTQLVGDQFLDWLSPQTAKTWLDIGCGNGAFTEQIYQQQNPSEIQAIDPSSEQIDFASRRIVSQRVTFQVGDAMDLQFKADHFDYATMALVLFFVPDPKVGVSEMIRVVKPDGVVSAYVWDIFGGGLPMEPINAQLRILDIPHPVAPSAEVSGLNSLESTWREAGLKEVEVKQISVDRTFANFEEFWDLTHNSPSVGPVLSKLPADVGHQVKKMAQDALGVDDSQTVTINAFANAVKGTV